MNKYQFDKIFTKNDDGYYCCSSAHKEQMEQILNEGDGYFIINGFPITEQSTEALEKDILKFSFTFGVPVSQSIKNDFILRIEDLKSKMDSTFSAEGYQDSGDMPPHNDRCDLLMLYGIQPATQGGYTRLIKSKLVCNQLSNEYPVAFEILQRDFTFDNSCYSKKDGDEYQLPILHRRDNGDFMVWYSKWFIQNAVRLNHNLHLSEDEIAALDILDKVIESNIERCMLQKGDILIVNNHRSLHSRQRFLAGDERLLYRVWLSIPDGLELSIKYKSIFGRVEKGSYRGGVWSDQRRLTDISKNMDIAKKEIKNRLFEGL